MTHNLHPEATATGRLDPGCDRCKEHTLASLDAGHLLTATGIDKAELDAFVRRYPQLWDVLMTAKALPVQRAFMEVRV